MQIMQYGLARSAFPFTRGPCNSARRDGRRDDTQVWVASRADHRALAAGGNGVARARAARRVVADRPVGGELRRRRSRCRSPRFDRARGAPLGVRSLGELGAASDRVLVAGGARGGAARARGARQWLARASAPAPGSPNVHRRAADAGERRRRSTRDRCVRRGPRRRPPVRGAARAPPGSRFTRCAMTPTIESLLASPGYRGELTAYCRRMLGSSVDAEDAVQETLLRAWRASRRFEGRASLRSWMYRIATNVCFDALGQSARRPVPVEALPEPVDACDEPDPSDRAVSRERLRLAIVAAVGRLPARQREVLLLRDVLSWRASRWPSCWGRPPPALTAPCSECTPPWPRSTLRTWRTRPTTERRARPTLPRRLRGRRHRLARLAITRSLKLLRRWR